MNILRLPASQGPDKAPRAETRPPAAPIQPELVSPAELKALSKAELSPQGVAAPTLELCDSELEVAHNRDGSKVVSGFPPGNPPPVLQVLEAAFPEAKDLKVISSDHQHPFDTYQVEVDGKPFTASFLFGGFRASDQFGIQPGHQKHGDVVVSDQPRPTKLPKLPVLQPLPAPPAKPQLQVEQHKDGGLTIKGFAPGNPPPLNEILKAAFPDAREIKVLSSESSHPFTSDLVEVDGKVYTASFLHGGFLPSRQYDLQPGRQAPFLNL